jgi:hypothetical protein
MRCDVCGRLQAALSVAKGMPACCCHTPPSHSTSHSRRADTNTKQGFHYANGVALSPDEDYLILVETDRIRLLRHWLKGPKVRAHCARIVRALCAHCVCVCVWRVHCTSAAIVALPPTTAPFPQPVGDPAHRRTRPRQHTHTHTHTHTRTHTHTPPPPFAHQPPLRRARQRCSWTACPAFPTA